jgi:hypothetical protein
MTSLVSGSEQWRRWKSEGVEGLVDRSSRPQSCPHQTSAVLEHQIAQLRRELVRRPGWHILIYHEQRVLRFEGETLKAVRGITVPVGRQVLAVKASTEMRLG